MFLIFIIAVIINVIRLLFIITILVIAFNFKYIVLLVSPILEYHPSDANTGAK